MKPESVELIHSVYDLVLAFGEAFIALASTLAAWHSWRLRRLSATKTELRQVGSEVSANRREIQEIKITIDGRLTQLLATKDALLAASQEQTATAEKITDTLTQRVYLTPPEPRPPQRVLDVK